MNGTLDDQYLTWLYEQVGDVKVRNPSRRYWKLFRQLLSTEFVWITPNDDNRVEDGRDLRREFLADLNADSVDPDWMDLGCSFLELFVSLARKLTFEAEGSTQLWFWHLMENLGLENCSDNSRYSEDEVNEVLNRLMFRTYEPDGRGGLFPLEHPDRDQREVEIWYQMNAYLLEQV